MKESFKIIHAIEKSIYIFIIKLGIKSGIKFVVKMKYRE